MKRCTFQWIDDKTLKISGTIDEYFTLADEVGKFKGEVCIDLGEIVRINSCGVREWIKVMSKMKSKVHYRNCSSVIVTQFSMIPEFLGHKGYVDSFEAQFVCPSCGHEDKMILEVGKDIKPGLPSYKESPEMECTDCGAAMECDHNPELYFSFLSLAS